MQVQLAYHKYFDLMLLIVQLLITPLFYFTGDSTVVFLTLLITFSNFVLLQQLNFSSEDQ